MKRPKLTRAKARFASGEHFAMLPRAVMESEAWRYLPDWGKTVTTALAGQYRGSGNGDLSLTKEEARILGVSPEWKLRAGLKIAERAGLIVLTRPGGNVSGGEKKPNLYALGWLPIQHSEKFAVPPGTLLSPPNGWCEWKRPADWAQQIEVERRKAQGKKKPHHTRVGQHAPHGGRDNASFRHTRVERRGQLAASHGGETSRDLGWERDNEAKVRNLFICQPHLSDFDIARALRWKVDPARVAALRQTVFDGDGQVGDVT